MAGSLNTPLKIPEKKKEKNKNKNDTNREKGLRMHPHFCINWGYFYSLGTCREEGRLCTPRRKMN